MKIITMTTLLLSYRTHAACLTDGWDVKLAKATKGFIEYSSSISSKDEERDTFFIKCICPLTCPENTNILYVMPF